MTTPDTSQPLVMEHRFYTIKQAAERYDVADITLRRLVREITKRSGHEQRDLVRPSAADLATLRQENRPFEYEISTKLLGLRYRERGEKAEEGSGSGGEDGSSSPASALGLLQSTNDLLRQQLLVKDEQIRQLNESLRAMQQQQNATSMVLTRLSDRLPLLAGPEPGPRGDVVEQHTHHKGTVGGGEPVKAEVKPKPKPKRRSSLLGRWF